MIDRSRTRDTPWDPVADKVADLFGTRVAKTILGAVIMCDRSNRTYDRKRSDQTFRSNKLLQPRGRPHMGPGSLRGRDDKLGYLRDSASPRAKFVCDGAE